jgi:hypothetical protein
VTASGGGPPVATILILARIYLFGGAARTKFSLGGDRMAHQQRQHNNNLEDLHGWFRSLV